MSCDATRFTITKGVDNTFVFTIKANGSTLPMEIADSSYTTTVSATPVVTFTPAVEEVIGVDEVLAVEEVAYVASQDEVLATNYLYSSDLPTFAVGSGNTEVFSFTINTVTYSYTHTETPTYTDKLDLLLAFNAVINGGTATGITKSGTGSPTGLASYANLNRLYITATEDYTLNSTSNIYLMAVSTYSAAVAEVEYVAPVAYVAPVTAVAPVAAYYTATNEAITVSFADLLPTNFSISEAVVTPSIPIAGITGATAVDGSYNIGANTSFEFTPVETLDSLASPLPSITFTIVVTVANPDMFTADLIALSDRSVALNDIPLTVENASSGRVQLIISSAQTDLLVSSRGAKTDRYYISPTYSLVISCSTAVNGDFVAKVAEVYVD